MKTTVKLDKKQIEAIYRVCDFCRATAHHDWKLKYDAAFWERNNWGPRHCTCQSQNQGEALIALFRIVYPNWDQIQSVDGHPQTNSATGTFIARLCIEYDRLKHPDVFAGGIWLNNGFGCRNEQLADFEVEPCPVTLNPTATETLQLQAA